MHGGGGGGGGGGGSFWFSREMFICAIYHVRDNRTVVEYFSKVIA
jgi:hypothetical protein